MQKIDFKITAEIHYSKWKDSGFADKSNNTCRNRQHIHRGTRQEQDFGVAIPFTSLISREYSNFYKVDSNNNYLSQIFIETRGGLRKYVQLSDSADKIRGEEWRFAK